MVCKYLSSNKKRKEKQQTNLHKIFKNILLDYKRKLKKNLHGTPALCLAQGLEIYIYIFWLIQHYS